MGIILVVVFDSPLFSFPKEIERSFYSWLPSRLFNRAGRTAIGRGFLVLAVCVHSAATGSIAGIIFVLCISGTGSTRAITIAYAATGTAPGGICRTGRGVDMFPLAARTAGTSCRSGCISCRTST